MKYYDLSQIVGEAERLEALKYGRYTLPCSLRRFAIQCAILAKAGPQRSRMLAMLYKDERSSKLEIHSILEKMYAVRGSTPLKSL